MIRRVRRRRAHVVFLDESGLLLTSTDRHDRISVLSAISISPSRRRVGLDFRLLPDDANVQGENTVAFLRELQRQLPVPMDSPVGPGQGLRPLQDRPRLLDREPGDRDGAVLRLHPRVEPRRRGDTKYGRLANFAPEDTAELRVAPTEDLERLHRRPRLSTSFIRLAEIPIRLRM